MAGNVEDVDAEDYGSLMTHSFNFSYQWSLHNVKSLIKSEERQSIFHSHLIRAYHTFKGRKFGAIWKLESEIVQDKVGEKALEVSLFLEKIEFHGMATMTKVQLGHVAKRSDKGKFKDCRDNSTHYVPLIDGAGFTTLFSLNDQYSCIVQDKIGIRIRFDTIIAKFEPKFWTSKMENSL